MSTVNKIHTNDTDPTQAVHQVFTATSANFLAAVVLRWGTEGRRARAADRTRVRRRASRRLHRVPVCNY
jgi:hypothetical protein